MRASKIYFIILLLFSAAWLNAQQLKIPFYDDFSKNGLTTPDSSLWLPTGVTLNNSYAINPPTQFVATFDGRNAKGFPYEVTNPNSVGTTDSLVSKPIDLSLFTAKDSLILSFFWQAKGLGDLPDSEDSLLVKFKTIDNKWVTVWRNDTIKIDNKFNQSLLGVNEQRFLHKNFQFAFITIGKQSGPFDTWHIDYIFFDKNRKKNERFYSDVAIQDIPKSLLKNYRAMPLNQYLVNPAEEINDSLLVRTNNLRQFGGALVRYDWRIFNSETKESFLDDTTGFRSFDGQLTIGREIKNVKITPSKPVSIAYGLKIRSTDNQRPFVVGVDKNNKLLIDSLLLTRNDSLYNTIVLDNYYAYDDGSAEVGAEVDLKLGRIAVQYILNKPDTLGAIRFNFSPFFTDKVNNNFLIQVFNSKNGKPDRELLNQTAKIEFPQKLNGFIEYSLQNNVAINDTFYISWTRLSEETVAVGFDKNSTQFSNRIYYNLGQGWLSNIGNNNTAKVDGSFMVRPVMGARKLNGEVVAEKPLAEEESISNELIVYPNPTTSVLRWNLEGEFLVKLFSTIGKEVVSTRTNQGFIDVSDIVSGLYVLQLQNQTSTFHKKVIIKK